MFQLLLPNPALRQLYVMRTLARLRRMRQTMSSPRRVVFSAIAIALPFVWIANLVASMVFRESFTAEAFRNGVLLVGVGYFAWYLLKASGSRPPAAIEWTPPESALMCGGPFPRADLIRYRLTVIFSATLLKALFTSLMFLPELGMWWAGFVGLLLGLAFLDLARMAAETILCGVSQRAYLKIRTAVLTIAGVALLSAAVSALSSSALETSTYPMALALPPEFGRQLADLRFTLPGEFLSAPLNPFVEIITASAISLELVRWLIISVSIVLTMAISVIRLDAMYADRNAETIRRSYAAIASSRRVRKRVGQGRNGLPQVFKLWGVGPIAWRQWLGARKYETSLLFALAVPAVLSCLPLLAPQGAIDTFLNVAGTLCVYSFLLLPAALKFDFRRDYDRLPVLKALPLHPLAIVVGQLTVPVLLTTLLQVFVLGIAFIFRPVPLTVGVHALLMILPINVVIFGLDNLIFLMFPYRQSDEGLQPFLRATMTFTAKGLLFFVALMAVFVWAFNCRMLSEFPLFARFGDHRILFIAGIWAMMVASAVTLTLLSARVFDRYDPSFDHVT